MNELYRTLEAAFAAAPEGDTRELIGQALDMLDTVPMEPLELLAKVERVRQQIHDRLPQSVSEPGSTWFGLSLALEMLYKEFPE